MTFTMKFRIWSMLYTVLLFLPITAAQTRAGVERKEAMIGQNRIIGGQFAADGRYPYAVSLTSFGTPYCGGSLIAPDVVLSAAHCAAQPNARVDIGRTDRNDVSDRFENFDNVKEYKHPSYLSISDRYDQMIIKLDGRSTAQTLKLNFDVAVPVSGNALTIMGWGVTKFGNLGGSSKLKDATVIYESNSVCSNSRDFFFSTYRGLIFDDMLCAQGQNTDTCSGDSGGPIILPGNDASGDLQVGVASWGFGCAEPNFPGVYSRVSFDAQWIKDTVCKISSAPPAYFKCFSPSAPSSTAPPTVRVTTSPAPATPGKLTPSYCFSGTTKVQSQNKGEVFMKDLQIGDRVLASTGKYETVYSFGHREEAVEAEFLQLLPSTLEISKDHMVLVNSRYAPASFVQVGDVLKLANGDSLTVEAIKTVVRTGVYAPFTTSGTIVVSNIKASTYIAFQDSDSLVVGGWTTPLSFQWSAHVSQAPHRMYRMLFGITGGEVYTENGISTNVELPLRFFEWYLSQHTLVMMLLLVPALILLLSLSAVELILSGFLPL